MMKKNAGVRPAKAHSRQPVFEGQRFTVFAWQIDSLRQVLGSYADGFNLKSWFQALDARAAATAIVLPRRSHEWLVQQTLYEAQRRGLNIAVTQQHVTPTLSKHTAALFA